MNDDDLKKFFAGLAMMGLLSSGERGEKVIEHAYAYADAMISHTREDEEPEEGITAIKPKRKVK
jgi:hypothetical protein